MALGAEIIHVVRRLRREGCLRKPLFVVEIGAQ
jgi:hypothetical protein